MRLPPITMKGLDGEPMALSDSGILVCKSEKCQRPFSVENKRLSHGHAEPEGIYCPHCDHLHSKRKTNGVFECSPLSPAAEEGWLAQRQK
jgi:hypothetical protein